MSSDSGAILSLNAKYVSYAHTICAASAFVAALIVGVSLHYEKIVENAHYGYPDEWFPSVSATIGDRYPERSIFQILIALTSGPRFLLLIISYIRLYSPERSTLSKVGVICGVIRTVTCGGWVYITSTDDHDAHDVFMISYIILTAPWEYYVTISTPKRTSLRNYRFYTSISFFGALIPLIYFFIQHKVHRIAGSYSIYAYFEWSLIILDILFDAWTAFDFSDLTIVLTSSKGLNFSVVETVESKKKEESTTDLKPKLKDDVSFLEIIVNTINSFIFWSVSTSLLLVIWYFPLWNMGISGFELTILSFLFSFLLVIPPIKKIVTNFPAITRVLTVVFGVGSYLIKDPDYRLLSIGIGCVFAFISFANETCNYGSNSVRSKYYATSFSLGLILSSIAKYSLYSNNPIWPIMHEENGGWNKTGVLIGLVSAILTPRNVISSVPSKESKPSLFKTVIGLGSLLFSLHAMATDSSTIITWVWDGYPIHGPVPVPHGAISIIVLLIGAYVGLTNEKIANFNTFIFGSISATILYLFHGYIGYIGGLGYIFVLIVLVPKYFENASHFNPGVVFSLASLVHILLILAHVWIVAYAFVPAGWILRERTDIVLGVSTFLVGFGILPNKEFIKLNVEKSLNKVKKLIYSFIVITLIISYLRFPLQDPKPYHPESKLITAGIWTIHFGLDNDMWSSEGRMRDLIRDAELDVIGLLESDTQRIIMGNRDLTQQLAEDLNMYADFGPGPNKHTWGCALLSKFPILNSTHHLLPSPVGELAPAIHATLDVYGELVDVVVFHSGQEEDAEDRLLQSLGVRDIMGSGDRPMILLSYLVTTPLEGNYNNYVSKESGMHDVDASDWDRWCEYILYKHLKRVGYARISRGTITDTELQTAKFVVGSSEKDSYSQERISKEEIDKDLRYPDKFYGEGIRGHAFHVFEEPRYFN